MKQKSFKIIVKNKILPFKKNIEVDSDKSLSIRGFLIGSICQGISTVKNVLESEDVKSTISVCKKLGVKITKKDKTYFVYGNGLGSFKKPKNNRLYAGNSGTLARMLFPLIGTQGNLRIKIIGDNSLNKRDMKRIIVPLSKIGCEFLPKNKTTLPLIIQGTDIPLAQKHHEKIEIF